jgi:hypothetical protein
VQVPADFPAEVIQVAPPGTVFSSIQPFPSDQGNAGYYVRGYAPLGYTDLAHYMLEQLPKAGYRVGGGDAETNEVEALFIKGNLSGALRSRAIEGCPNDSLIEIAISDTTPRQATQPAP